MSGTSTWAESQGKRMPPKVSPVIASVAPAMMMELPLKNTRREHRNMSRAEDTHIQSMRPSFSLMFPGGVRTRRKNSTRRSEIPHRGRFRSAGS